MSLTNLGKARPCTSLAKTKHKKSEGSSTHTPDIHSFAAFLDKISSKVTLSCEDQAYRKTSPNDV